MASHMRSVASIGDLHSSTENNDKRPCTKHVQTKHQCVKPCIKKVHKPASLCKEKLCVNAR